MKKVNVLIPTYNGENYLRYQLDSIIDQNYKNIDVYIRDDGSTDNTLEIIKEYCEKKIMGIRFFYIESNGENLGYPDCIWKMIEIIPSADYYAFCDQDDWWAPDKIKSAVELLEQVDNQVPAMTFCKFDYYNQNMEYIRHGDCYNGKLTFEKGIYYTFAPGFTQVVNKALIDKLEIEYLLKKGVAHDIWCQWVSLSIGIILPDDRVLSHYRRHEKAVTSANVSKIKIIKRWWNKEIKGDDMCNWQKSFWYFKNKHLEEIDDKYKKTLLLFANINPTLLMRLKKAFYLKRLRPTIGGEVVLRILFLLKKC